MIIETPREKHAFKAGPFEGVESCGTDYHSKDYTQCKTGMPVFNIRRSCHSLKKGKHNADCVVRQKMVPMQPCEKHSALRSRLK
jgi:hypothetical protein